MYHHRQRPGQKLREMWAVMKWLVRNTPSGYGKMIDTKLAFNWN